MKSETMGSRIHKRRKELKLSQVSLSKVVGVSNVAISQWERDETSPRGDALLNLAEALQCSAEYLVNGGDVDHNIEFRKERTQKGMYPVISWVSAGQWSEAIEAYPIMAVDRWYGTTEECHASSFWLDVKGDSMTSPVGLSIPEGMAILVDPEAAPDNGKLVVAKLVNDNEATFKKLVIDSGRRFLKPLNPQYPMIEINGNCQIIGVVVDAKITNLP
ncbi:MULTISPECIES: LexA family protein [Edwardsiella]|uniref:LexA family transcriptional regulator n=1 Tax=Edwardsiella anguillarum TaxID=1821960 RepID=A0ABY8SBA3_9GAMM|nr:MULTISPECIES: LexA family transcriptional regulator [Edwardsiella]AKR78427.1 LexA family transcriptional regulator [Edwardsiella sp. LADL05-105]KAB0586257.1 LexA family transcriptional regulator [Edwardsiella anguillarum]UOU78169.1 LexA family transcriptional regulator [Edwardsiella anguillarum]WHP82935.1 LexA family transcriptional regulator [Edwardsiella anguillarum]WHP86732.1 LexA family transcriptional regulator [Edwardsiella anguillarum]